MYHKMDLNVSTKCKWTQEYVNAFYACAVRYVSVRISSLKRIEVALKVVIW